MADDLCRLSFIDAHRRATGSKPDRNGNAYPVGAGPMPVRIANRIALSQLRNDNQFRLVCQGEFSRQHLRSADGSLAGPRSDRYVLGRPLCRNYRTIGLPVDCARTKPILYSLVYGIGGGRLGLEDFHSPSRHRRMARVTFSPGICRGAEICLLIGRGTGEFFIVR